MTISRTLTVDSPDAIIPVPERESGLTGKIMENAPMGVAHRSIRKTIKTDNRLGL